MLRFSLLITFVLAFSLNSCDSKSPEKSVESQSIENGNEITRKKKVDDKDTANENYKSHTKKISPRKKYEFPEVY